MLIYNGVGHIPHVPSRDLSDTDIQELIEVKHLFSDENEAVSVLTSRGIYSLPKPKRTPRVEKEPDTLETEDES